ncbi:MAG TPA: alanine racemase [Candidatus Saccharimonadales bacterium]|nr:alanine racemase [Candidatus Saccharimonadales bacterium]
MSLTSLFKKKYYPLNTIEISAYNLKENFTYLANLSDQQIAPVLKSNAYGHGLVQTAKILDECRAPFFCVDSLYEAYELLKAKIKTPILIMGYVNPYNLKVKKLPFSYVAYDLELIAALNEYQPGAGVHIFVDTGMHREGIPLDELEDFLYEAKKFTKVHIEGLMSHFGDANDPDNELTKKQIENFQKAEEIMRRSNITIKWTHISASGGVLQLQKYQQQLGNVARTGIALYGYDPKGVHENLKPALQVKTTLAQIKELKKGEKVGYDFTFTAPKDMIIGILPIGYFDGVDRRLSNVGYVKIENHFCQIIGKVSMNITVIDITEIQNAEIGQEVIVYSNTLSDKNSLYSAADLCKTIPYELLVHLSPTTKRKAI